MPSTIGQSAFNNELQGDAAQRAQVCLYRLLAPVPVRGCLAVELGELATIRTQDHTVAAGNGDGLPWPFTAACDGYEKTRPRAGSASGYDHHPVGVWLPRGGGHGQEHYPAVTPTQYSGGV